MSHNILFIEDYEPAVVTMEFVIEDLGHSFTHAIDAADAIEKVQNQDGSFDLIMVDYNLPDMRGDELAKQIRKISKDSKIVGFTAEPDNVSEDAAQAFDELVQKSLQPSDIEEFLKSWLG